MSSPAVRPRVLLMTETYWPEMGGGERQARLLAGGLVERGYEVTIVTRRSRASLPRREHDGGVLVLRLPPAGPGRWLKWVFVLPAFATLLFRRRRYDVVLVSGFRHLGVAALAARTLTGKPAVLKADSAGEFSGEYFRTGLALSGIRLDSWPVRRALRLRNAMLRRADAFVSLSRAMTDELVAHGVPAVRVYRIGNGVDTDAFRPANPQDRAVLRRHLALPAGAVVVYTGRLVAYKGLPLLLQAWRNIFDATLVLVGEGGRDVDACEDALRAYVAEHCMNGRVRFTGAVDNVQDWLRAADAFVFPTENEAFGLSLAEAMACGLPCVTTAVGGLGDFVVHGVNAIAIPQGDAAALETAMRQLLADEALRLKIGRAARRTAVERFAAAAVSDAYGRLLDRVATPATVGGAS